jgi:hypothetical protein
VLRSHRSTRKKFALSLAAIAVVAAVTVVSLSFTQQPKASNPSQQDGSGLDLLERRTQQLAGLKAVDCGRVAIRAEPEKSTDCALAANRAEKPFRVRYDLQGIDSAVAVAFVRLPDGTVEALSYDSNPSGSPGLAEVVRTRKCPEPVHLYATPRGHLTCFPPKSPAPRDPMSPTLDTY